MASICTRVFILTVSMTLTIAFSAPTHEETQLELEDNNHKGSYAFSYTVNSPSNGDIKSQSETRVDNSVTGEYNFLQPDDEGCIRHVTYTAGVNGFVPVVHYEGNCSSDNIGDSSKKTGAVVTDFTVPVTGMKKESHESAHHPHPQQSHIHKVPMAKLESPSKLRKGSSKTDRTPLKAHTVTLNTSNTQSPHSLTSVTPLNTAKTFFHFPHTDYDYYDYDNGDYDYRGNGDYDYRRNGRPTIIIFSDRMQSYLNFSEKIILSSSTIPVAATATSSVTSQSVHSVTESHGHTATITGPEHHHSIVTSNRDELPHKEYAHVQTTFTMPDSHHYEEAKPDSHTSKLPHKTY